MRPSRTPHESAAIALVRQQLTGGGLVPVDDESVTDKPDWVFEIGGSRIAAECTCINLEKLMKWSGSHRQMEPGGYYEVRFANEPHLWIRKALDAKEPKAASYRERTLANEVWLIAHSDFEPEPLYPCPPYMLDMMRDAASAATAMFDQVWFAHPEVGAHRLWRVGDPRTRFPELLATESYRTLGIKQGIGYLTDKGAVFSVLPEHAIESVRLSPLDQRFVLSEDGRHAIPRV